MTAKKYPQLTDLRHLDEVGPPELVESEAEVLRLEAEADGIDERLETAELLGDAGEAATLESRKAALPRLIRIARARAQQLRLEHYRAERQALERQLVSVRGIVDEHAKAIADLTQYTEQLSVVQLEASGRANLVARRIADLTRSSRSSSIDDFERRLAAKRNTEIAADPLAVAEGPEGRRIGRRSRRG